MIKRIIFSIAFVAISLIANAGWFIAGDFSLGFSNKKTESLGFTAKTVSFGINPAVGYVFKGKFGVALALGYGNGFEEINYLDNSLGINKEIKSNNWKISPFFRYVICNFNNKICFYSDLAFRITVANFTTKSLGYDIDSSKKTLAVEIAPALSYALTKNLSIFAKFHFLTLGYYHTVEKTDVETIENQFDFGGNNQTLISAGLVYIFK